MLFAVDKMVQVHELSSTFIKTLEEDFQNYKKSFHKTVASRPVGFQVPHTTTRWMNLYYQETIKKRQNILKQTAQQFNRSLGKPVDAIVFKNAKEFVRCLSQIKVEDSGNVVYRPASDPVWRSLRR